MDDGIGQRFGENVVWAGVGGFATFDGIPDALLDKEWGVLIWSGFGDSSVQAW